MDLALFSLFVDFKLDCQIFCVLRFDFSNYSKQALIKANGWIARLNSSVASLSSLVDVEVVIG